LTQREFQFHLRRLKTSLS